MGEKTHFLIETSDMDMKAPIRVGLVQACTPADQLAALAHIEDMIVEAAAQGARFVVTPEGSNLLEQRKHLRLNKLCTLDEDPCVFGLGVLAKRLGIYLQIGSAIVACPEHEADGRGANRSVLIGPDGKILSTYDKLHVFDVDLPNGERYRESESIRPGDRAVVTDLPFGRLGMTICYDVRFAHLFRALAKAGANIITVPAAFTRPTGRAHWEVLLRARAIETGAFVLAPAQGGTHEDGRSTWGHSMVVSPWGEVIASLDHDQPGVLIADLDLSEVSVARQSTPQLTHDREFFGP